MLTFADKVNWLIDHALPAGRGPYSNTGIAALIKKVTPKEEFPHIMIWKLRNGQATNPGCACSKPSRTPSASRLGSSSTGTTCEDSPGQAMQIE